MRSMFGNKSKKFLEELFVYQREKSLITFLEQDLTIRQNIIDSLEPYTATIIKNKDLSSFLVMKWSDEEAT